MSERPTAGRIGVDSTHEEVEEAIGKALIFWLLPCLMIGVLMFFTLPLWLPFYALFLLGRYIKDLLTNDTRK